MLPEGPEGYNLGASGLFAPPDPGRGAAYAHAQVSPRASWSHWSLSPGLAARIFASVRDIRRSWIHRMHVWRHFRSRHP
jgi:hypothetical protein